MRRWLPVAVSAGILAGLATRLELPAVASALDARAALILAPALLVYGAVTLLLEALSLVRLLPAHPLSPTTAARLKAASYLPAILHFGLGVGALSLLLRRRVGVELGAAAGVVLLLSAVDFALLLGLCLGGAAVLGTVAPPVRPWVVAGLALGLGLGFLLLRAPGRLALLERLRSLGPLRAAAFTPGRRLAAVGVLRLAFVASFVGLVALALRAFGVSVPPGDLLVGVLVVSFVAALPIAVSGLGTGQAAFLFVFRPYGTPETLLACSLALSAGLIALRGGMGALFAREYAREAARLVREEAR